MTQTDPRPRPPRLAAWLVNMFASARHAESILGDLHEEFFDLASKSGVGSARGWYWRQSANTILHLVGAAFRTAPWSLACIVLFGFLLRWFSFSLPERLVVAILRTQRPYSNHHVNAYISFLNYGIPVTHFLTSLLIGCVMACFAKGREVVATVTLALVLSVMVGIALVHVATHGPMDVVWMLWSFADPWALVCGGVIVQGIRSARLNRPSNSGQTKGCP